MTGNGSSNSQPCVLVAMSGGVDSSVAAALLVEAGCRGGRRVHAQRRHRRRRAPRSPGMLRDGRRGRRPPRRGPARNPVLRRRPRGRVRRPDGRVRRRVPPRPHAEPVHRVQPPVQVRAPAGSRGRGGRRRRRDRPLRADRPTRERPPRDRARRATPRRTSRTCCFRCARKSSRGPAFPLAPFTKPEVRATGAGVRSQGGREAREHGDLLRPVGRLPRPRAGARSRSRGPRRRRCRLRAP